MESFYSYILRQINEKYPVIHQEFIKTINMYNDIQIIFLVLLMDEYENLYSTDSIFVGLS